jgi:hypothetical protein
MIYDGFSINSQAVSKFKCYKAEVRAYYARAISRRFTVTTVV